MVPRNLLTLGTPVYDDFDGLYFTLKALQIYHNEVFENSEIIVVDNNPSGIDTSHVERLIAELNYNNNVRLIQMREPRGTAPAKQKVIDSASNDWVVVFDSHVLFAPDAFKYLIRAIESGEHDRDILSGPLMGANNKGISTHYLWKWRGQLLGIWGTNPLAEDIEGPPFEIPGVGTGVFAVNRKHFPGFHPAFRGFGAEEMYIHEKVRRNGGAAFCIPGFRWHHRFFRPRGVPYPNIMWDRVRNYVIGFLELGLDVNEVYNYYVKSGFFSEKDWKYLIEDPINRISPPKYFEIADDAPERAKIVAADEGKADMKVTAVPSQYQQFVKEGGSVQSALEKQIRQKIASMSDAELEGIPLSEELIKNIATMDENTKKKVIRVYREGVMFSRWKEAYDKAMANPQVTQQGGCGGCKQNQAVSVRQDVVENLKKSKSISEVKTLPTDVDDTYKELIKNYVKQADKILEIGDDPIGVTAVVIESMDEDDVFVSIYEDNKFIPELNELGRLAYESGKSVKIMFGLDQLDIKEDVFDLAIINPIFPDMLSVHNILQKILPHVKGRVIVHKTDKYGAKTPDNKPGIMPGVTKFLHESGKLEWSVVKVYKQGQGAIIMSNLPEDKPKLPSNITIAANFAKAITKHIATGAKEVTKDELEFRLKQCSICEHRVEDRCSVCGCYITSSILSKGKAFWKDQVCPLGKWQGYNNQKSDQ